MNQIIEFLKILSEFVPVEVFAFIGSITEELIAPIPSPLVLTIAGTIAKAYNMPFIFLIWLAVIASAGKTIASMVYYLVADKAEDIVLTKFGYYIGVTHDDVERIGKKFDGSWNDDLILIAARAIPFMPTSIVSAVSGFIKLNKGTFIRGTFVGYVLRSLLFLYFGFVGLSVYGQVEIYITSIETRIKYIFIICILLVAIFTIFKIIQYKRFYSNTKKDSE